MSDVMLHGVLNMPPELWRDDAIDQAQRHSRYVEASKRIEALEWALKDAKGFSELVEIWGRTDCEIYKHELKSSADLSLSRINKALDY